MFDLPIRCRDKQTYAWQWLLLLAVSFSIKTTDSERSCFLIFFLSVRVARSYIESAALLFSEVSYKFWPRSRLFYSSLGHFAALISRLSEVSQILISWHLLFLWWTRSETRDVMEKMFLMMTLAQISFITIPWTWKCYFEMITGKLIAVMKFSRQKLLWKSCQRSESLHTNLYGRLYHLSCLYLYTWKNA